MRLMQPSTNEVVQPFQVAFTRAALALRGAVALLEIPSAATLACEFDARPWFCLRKIVELLMLCVGEKLEILQSVIVPNAVLVMHMLVCLERSADVRGHDNAVLEIVFADSDLDLNVSVGASEFGAPDHLAPSHPAVLASARAVRPRTPIRVTDNTRLGVKSLSAHGTLAHLSGEMAALPALVADAMLAESVPTARANIAHGPNLARERRIV